MVLQQLRSTTRGSNYQAGFTLIDLMIGLVVATIVVAAAFTILTTTSKALRANEQVVGAQQNIRMAMELLTRDIKLAGFGNPGVTIGNCNYPIVPQDQNVTGADTGADSVQLQVPTTRTELTNTDPKRWTLSVKTGTSGITQITLQPGAVADMVSSGLVANQSYISIGGSATALVTGLSATASTHQQRDPRSDHR